MLDGCHGSVGVDRLEVAAGVQVSKPVAARKVVPARVEGARCTLNGGGESTEFRNLLLLGRFHFAMKIPCVLALVIPCAAAVDAAEWPGFRGPNGDNRVPAGDVATSFPDAGPRVVWSLDVNPGYGGAAVSDGEVFFLDRVDQERDVIRCVGLSDGKERWFWEREVAGRISHPGSRGVPTAEKDAVYASSGFGHVYCVDRKSHKERWVIDVAKVFDASPPRFGYSIHPVIHGDKCIIAPTGDSVGLAALNKKTGETLWTTGPVGDSHSSPLLVKLLGKEMVVMPGSSRGTLMFTGFDPESGKQLFQYTEQLNPGIHNSIPNITVLDEGSAVLTGGYGQGTKLLKFIESDGAISVTRSGNLEAGSKLHPALRIDDKIYMVAGGGGGGGGARRGPGGFRGRPRGGDGGGAGRPQGAPGGARPQGRPGGAGGRGGGESGLVCTDLAGEVLWSTKGEPGLNSGSIIEVGGIIVSQDGDDGSLRLIKPGASYKEIARGKVFRKDTGSELWAPLAFADGLLLMRSQNEMVCVDLRPATEGNQ